VFLIEIIICMGLSLFKGGTTITSVCQDFNPTIEEINKAELYTARYRGLDPEYSRSITNGEGEINLLSQRENIINWEQYDSRNGNANPYTLAGELDFLSKEESIIKWEQYDSIGQIVSSFNGRLVAGTGCLYKISQNSKKGIVLTCAYLFARELETLEGEIIIQKYDAANFYLRRRSSSIGNRFRITSVIYYPEYFNDMSRFGGRNLAIALVEGSEIPSVGYPISSKITDHLKGEPILLKGYPSKKKGDPYLSKGRIIDDNSIVILHDAYASDGDSGAPILAWSSRDENSLLRNQAGPVFGSLSVIGINIEYSGGDKASFGMKITKTVSDWITEVAEKFLK